MVKKILILAFTVSLIGGCAKSDYETCIEKIAAGLKKGTEAEKEAIAARSCARQMNPERD